MSGTASASNEEPSMKRVLGYINEGRLMSLGQWLTPNRSVNLTAPRPVDGFSGPAKRGIGGGHMDAGSFE